MEWRPTQFLGVAVRGDKFRVMFGRQYIGTFSDINEGRAALEKAQGTKARTIKSRREKIDEFRAKCDVYLDWAADVGFEPADLAAGKKFRKQCAELPRAAPATYHLAAEGKTEPWWKTLLGEYSRLSAKDKMALQLLTSEVPGEFQPAATVQHRIYCNALRKSATPAVAGIHRWWATEVNHNVAHHMGWLAKAQQHGVLVKVRPSSGRVLKRPTRGRGVIKGTKGAARGCGMSLGCMGHTYRLVQLTPAIVERYRALACLTTALSAMPVPVTFADYAANRSVLAKMPSAYHNLWYFRFFFELERWATYGNLPMHVHRAVTIDEFTNVFPDAVGWLRALGRATNSKTVVTVLNKIGYTRRDLPISLVTMHLCFAGQLGQHTASTLRKLGQHHLRSATREHQQGGYFGHPAKVFAAACDAMVRSSWGPNSDFSPVSPPASAPPPRRNLVTCN